MTPGKPLLVKTQAGRIMEDDGNDTWDRDHRKRGRIAQSTAWGLEITGEFGDAAEVWRAIGQEGNWE